MILVPGEYPDPRPDAIEDGRAILRPYFVAKTHRRKTLNSFVSLLCSAGWDPQNPQPCVGCHEAQSGDRTIDSGRGPASIYIFNLVHLVDYHLVPDIDEKTRNVRVNQTTGQPYMTKVPCEGRGCPHCRGNADLHFGAKKYLEVGSGHLDNLKMIDAQIGRLCMTCRKGEISTASFECPDCGHVLIDCTRSAYTEKELDQFAGDHMACPSCKRVGQAVETSLCSHCQDPRKTGIFDVVLWLCRQGAEVQSKITMVHPNPQAVGWCYLDDFAVGDNRPLVTGFIKGDDYTVTPKWDDEVAKLVVPYDFSDMTGIGKPLSLPDQARRLQVPNPFATAPAATDYAKGAGPSFRR